MPIDDAVEIRLTQVKQDVDAGIQADLSAATVAGILSLIPGVGSAIQSLLDGKARQNVERRWVALFAELKDRIAEIRDSIPDDSYYRSEEFQTLLALSYQQLLSTHRSEKITALATALANSGSTRFQEDDKELLVRLIGEVSPSDLASLKDERLQSTYSSERQVIYTVDDIARYSRLAGMGLVVEQFISGYGGGPPNAGRDRHYFLSELGRSFLRFISHNGE